MRGLSTARRTALIAVNEQYSYRDLESWSVLIAAVIEDLLGPGTEPVAALIGDSPAAVAAMLGIAERAVHS